MSDPNSSWTPSAPAVEGENDTMSNAQRSTLKWEKEEALGEMATVAPVLYTNINFPNLKEEFPGKSWNVAVHVFTDSLKCNDFLHCRWEAFASSLQFISLTIHSMTIL